MRKYFSEDYVIPSPKLNEHQKKKVFAENWSGFSSKFGKELKVLFVWSSSAQISIGGHLNLDGEMLNLDRGTLTLNGGMRPPASPLQFKYCLK